MPEACSHLLTEITASISRPRQAPASSNPKRKLFAREVTGRRAVLADRSSREGPSRNRRMRERLGRAGARSSRLRPPTGAKKLN